MGYLFNKFVGPEMEYDKDKKEWVTTDAGGKTFSEAMGALAVDVKKN